MNGAGRALVQVRGLYKAFGAVTVLHGIDLDVKEGEVVVIIGPSGSGKSTFIRCINGLEAPTAGRITVEGHMAEAGNRKALDALRSEIGRAHV